MSSQTIIEAEEGYYHMLWCGAGRADYIGAAIGRAARLWPTCNAGHVSLILAPWSREANVQSLCVLLSILAVCAVCYMQTLSVLCLNSACSAMTCSPPTPLGIRLQLGFFINISITP